MARERESGNQSLTVYLSDGAVSGYVMRLHDTEVLARMDSRLPQSERLRFLLQLQGGVISGEVTCVEQAERVCRLQFAALTASERDRLAPFLESEE